MPSLIKISPVVLEKILKFCQCTFVITPLGKGCCIHLKKKSAIDFYTKYVIPSFLCLTLNILFFEEEEKARKGGKGKFKIAKLHLITSY